MYYGSKNLFEQSLFGSQLERVYADPKKAREYNKMYEGLSNEIVKKLKQKRKENPILFDTIVSLGLWVIPYIGPVLATSYGLGIAIDNFSKGKYVEGVIEVICSPPMIGMFVKIAPKIGLKLTAKMSQMLLEIHKSGITVLISYGQQSFLKWGIKNFGEDFLELCRVLKLNLPENLHGTFFSNVNEIIRKDPMLKNFKPI